MADSVGMIDIREEEIDRIVKNFALEEFKMLPLCTISTSNGWKNTYYQETATDLTGGTGSAVAGVPRLANFPYGQVTWTETNEYLKKYGMDAVVSWEDAHTDAIDTIARTLLRVTRAVANAVDEAIITELATTTNTAAAVATWDNATIASRDPIYDIMVGIKAMQVYNYDPINGAGFIVLHPANYMELVTHADVKGSSRYFLDDGKVQRICGLQIIVANSATENTVLLGIKKQAMTWYQAQGLTTKKIENFGVSYIIRAFMVGIPVLTDNYAAYKITAC